MKILFFGSTRTFNELSNNPFGQAWDLVHAATGSDINDILLCHSFHAILVEACKDHTCARNVLEAVKGLPECPIIIGINTGPLEELHSYPLTSQVDLVLSEVGDDALLKSQLDAVVRLAYGWSSDRLAIEDVVLHLEQKSVSVNGAMVKLTKREYQLLELMSLSNGRTVTVEKFFNHVYGWDNTPQPKILDVLVCQLRRKLRRAGSIAECIETRWGEGYAIKSQNNGLHSHAA